MGEAHIAWKTAWITGASSGIGLELARLLDGKVTHLAVSARSQDKLSKLAAQCKNVVSYPLDVTDANAVADSVGDIEAAAGPIDLAVLNAGVWQLMDVAELDLALRWSHGGGLRVELGSLLLKRRRVEGRRVVQGRRVGVEGWANEGRRVGHRLGDGADIGS